MNINKVNYDVGEYGFPSFQCGANGRYEILQTDEKTHSRFGEALRQAQRAGVQVLAYECKVTPDSLIIDKAIPVKL